MIEYFEHEGAPFIAMEYLERGSLRPLVGQLTLAQVAGVLDSVLGGLAEAASQGIVHRDLKPENVLVTADGLAKVADFGIAKAIGQVCMTDFRTATGQIVGIPAYMAPEQISGGEYPAAEPTPAPTASVDESAEQGAPPAWRHARLRRHLEALVAR